MNINRTSSAPSEAVRTPRGRHSRRAPRRAILLITPLALAGVFVGASLPGSPFASTAQAAPQRDAVVSVSSGRCLDVAEARRDAGAPVIIWDCHDGANQAWQYSFGRLTTYGTMCLVPQGGGTSNGTPVVIADCAFDTAQWWLRRNDGTYRNFRSGLCLGILGGGTANGSRLVQWTCDGSANQRWTDSRSRASSPTPGTTTTTSATPTTSTSTAPTTSTTTTPVTTTSTTSATPTTSTSTAPTTSTTTTPATTTTTSPAAPPAPSGQVTWTLNRVPNPTEDQLDAYARITQAMDAAVARYNRLTTIKKQINVNYSPGVPTAEGSSNGTISFGSNRGYMQEGTALHELAHTMGVGQTGGWYGLGGSGRWTGPKATALVQSWDGPDAAIWTGGGHFWPYGLNYANEYNEQNFERNVLVVAAMLEDGM